MEVKYIEEPLYRLTWDEVMEACRNIAVEAEKSFGPSVIVGVAKGGLIPATIVASILRVDLFPCLVTRRRRGEVVHEKPEVVVSVSEHVAGQRVLVVDEMVMTGETMRVVSAQCKKQKARHVRTACLWASSESWKPTFYAMETAGYIMFPWDYEVLSSGKFILNPLYQEYLESLEMVSRWSK
ncbi:MAG TPA: phosphoribosyltransferase [Firmicutes bacterium]|nr:phosphoribosyltransferase [Candidatus Fermentithermobacillaceae bacterium]